LIFGDDQVETQSETTYNTFVGAFWSRQQRDITPQCVFKPDKALDVSTSILLSRLTQCPFAARSGGHSAVPGGSNIAGGITISLEKMNKTTLSADKNTVSYEPGQTWYDVYMALEKDNVAIIGGRVSENREEDYDTLLIEVQVADVGVGGLTLGGGKC
jgi:FAD/FMN-containing dehydrogenase